MSAPIFVHIAYSNLRDVRIACPISAGRPLSGTGVTENVRVLDGLDVQTSKVFEVTDPSIHSAFRETTMGLERRFFKYSEIQGEREKMAN